MEQQGPHIGDRVRRQREQRGWNQSELARQLGTTRQHVWLIEHGKQGPGAKLLLELARVLGVTPQYLMGQELVQAGR
jgi:transcriptional regulator with XRE-family HTH domain